ncbi:MAG: restriction endonuclease, partial [Gemmatimonadetes bacterium]|nr:restriction endonuclease [Gemmatimonadota bacterium]
MSQVVQDDGRERLTRIVAVASLVASFTYIAWRWGWTLDREALWFSVPLLIAETYGLVAAVFLTVTAWRLRARASLPALPDRAVDVFVTTAFEPIAIIRKTALAAREIRYPHTTWLLDDGHRDDVRTVAEEIGIRYLRRDVRDGAKAGNLNHALQHATGEFILQLDADHVPLPQIIDRMIGFFADDRVAVAQSPQDFYNTDAFTDVAGARGRQLWGDQQLFFNVLQPGKDRANAAMFVGSCAMLRRAALDAIGGFAPHTAVMGTETSLLLHAAGWQTVYLNENLAFGLAPSTAHAYQVQQLHRAQGAMHTMRRYQPLALPGLSATQRVMYLDTLATPLGGVQRLILYLAPIVFLTTGAFPVRASVGMFAAFFLPAVLLRALSFRLLTRGQGSLLHTDRYWMAKFFTHVIALRAYVTRRALSYRPRPDEAGSVPLRTVAPQLALIGLTAAALGWAIYARTIGYGTEVPGWGSIALYGAVVLALWHAGLAAHVVQLSLAGRHRRAEHRFSESLSVTLRVLREDGKLSSTDIAMTEDLTATGLALRGMYPIPEGARVELALPLSTGEVQVRGRVVRHSTIDTELGTVHLAGVEFDTTSRETRDAIELHCAQHAMPIEQQRHRQSTLGSGALRGLRDARSARRVSVGMPARVMTGPEGAGVEVGVGLLEEVSPRGGRVVLDSPVAEGTELTLHIPGSTARVSGRVVFVHALQTGVGMRFVAGFETEMPAAPAGAAAPAAPWYAAIVQLASRYGQSAAQGTRLAADTLAKGSRATVEAVTV